MTHKLCNLLLLCF